MKKAYLLPNQHTVLVKEGRNFGISSLVKRKNFKGDFQIPVRYSYTDLWVYPDFTVRNTKGKYLGKYLGFEQDRFNPVPISDNNFGGMGHDIFVLFEIEDNVFISNNAVGHSDGLYINVKPGEIHQICPVYERDKPSPEQVITQRLGWDNYEKIKLSNVEMTLDGLNTEEKIASMLSNFPIQLLVAAVELYKLRQRIPEKRNRR